MTLSYVLQGLENDTQKGACGCLEYDWTPSPVSLHRNWSQSREYFVKILISVSCHLDWEFEHEDYFWLYLEYEFHLLPWFLLGSSMKLIMIVASIESVSYFFLLQILTNVLQLSRTIAAWMPHAATQMARITVSVKEASSGTVSGVQVPTKTSFIWQNILSEKH